MSDAPGDQPRRLFAPADLPEKISAIEGIDFGAALTIDPLGSEWFRLGTRPLPGLSVAAHQTRECFLVPIDDVPRTFELVDYVGEALRGLGLPASWQTTEASGESSYAYHPAHSFELLHSDFFVEPLISERHGAGEENTFLINPDLWLHLGLGESPTGSGTWCDPASGTEILRRRQISDAKLEVVEIRRDALLRYLRDRQRALVVGEYRAARRDRPTTDDLAAFDTVDIVLEREQPYRAKVMVRSNGPGAGITRKTRDSLYRWLHLWFCILPPALNTERAFDEESSFDVYAFTLPTRGGEAAPWRYRGAAARADRPFAGVFVEHMTPVYFRQGVLEKYQGSATYAVEDDGGVRCGHFWSTGQSTRRIANEFVAVPIGDFGIGVPPEEWAHWKQFAASPSRETLEVAYSEPAIVSLVNDLVEKLQDLSRAFYVACFNHGIDGDRLWDGSLDTPAGRNLKRYYRDNAHDDEFLERTTFAATLTLDELRAKPLRAFLQSFDPELHLAFDTRLPLRSFNLLQRVALVTRIAAEMHPRRETIGQLVRAAEGYGQSGLDPALVRDLEATKGDVRKRLAPLAFLADLRNTGGVAHRQASPETIGTIVAKFGLPSRGWKRRDYLVLLKAMTDGVAAASLLLTDR